jgi:hypothetical protein
MVFVVAAALLYFWRQRKKSFRKPFIMPQRVSPPPPHPLRKKLLELCQGDKALVDRLYLSAKRSGKSTEWIYQKAIDDLIRDRSR